MKTTIAALAAVAASVAPPCVSAQQPPEVAAEQQELTRERIAMGQALLIVLKDPGRCGAPAPKGYACALIAYKDVSRRDKADVNRLPEKLTGVVTELVGADGLPREAKVKMLSPFESQPHPYTFPVFALPRLNMRLTGGAQENAVIEMQGVLGYAENEALPAKDPRKILRKYFKLPTNLQGTAKMFD
jgi:hypothetical protein